MNESPKAAAPEVRERVIVRGDFGFDLYEVEKETAMQVQGHRIEGRCYSGSRVALHRVVKRNATTADFAACVAARERHDRAVKDARDVFEAFVRAISENAVERAQG